jgi:ABC-2 type transport system ATP-binding protein
MGTPAITVEGLTKTFDVPVRPPGVRAALRSLFRRESRRVTAVEAISFEVEAGEVVGFLGPNGAGKTTTLKMLSGLLHPTGGTARVLGHEPWRREHAFLRRMTLVMGQRNQLIWDIPVADSFERNRAIYRVDPATYRRIIGELTELLELGPLLERPVRNLSLGERMKCELAVALLHEPQVLFLDEPTIGLDVTMQRRIREFIAGYNRRTGATVLLTSHYMADVEALCRRVIVIHHGRILFDGQLAGLVSSFASHKTVTFELDTPPPADLSDYGEVVSRDGLRVVLRVPKSDTPKLTARLLADLPVLDLVVEDPPIEEVIERVFAGEPGK